MTPETFRLGRAKALIQHAQAYDFDERSGLYVYRVVDEQEAWNLVTDGGRVAIHTYIYGTSAQRSAASLSGTGFNNIALSNDAAAPAAVDTTLAGELSGNGLTRAAADSVTLASGAGTTTTLQKIFTYTGGSSQAVQKTALFDALSAGRMAHEISFSQRTLFTNDVLTVTYSISLA
jgi:hypothetical protein